MRQFNGNESRGNQQREFESPIGENGMEPHSGMGPNGSEGSKESKEGIDGSNDESKEGILEILFGGAQGESFGFYEEMGRHKTIQEPLKRRKLKTQRSKRSHTPSESLKMMLKHVTHSYAIKRMKLEKICRKGSTNSR